MRNKIIVYSLIFFISILSLGCSNGSVLQAPNGKKYYIDIDNCDRYTLNRDMLSCYDSDEPTAVKTYMPVEFGYNINTRESY